MTSHWSGYLRRRVSITAYGSIIVLLLLHDSTTHDHRWPGRQSYNLLCLSALHTLPTGIASTLLLAQSGTRALRNGLLASKRCDKRNDRHDNFDKWYCDTIHKSTHHDVQPSSIRGNIAEQQHFESCGRGHFDDIDITSGINVSASCYGWFKPTQWQRGRFQHQLGSRYYCCTHAHPGGFEQ